MNKFFGHLKTILTHKWWVFKYACKLGIPWQGFMHDMSKFHPTEFFESVKYYKGTSSPIPECKKDKGYSLAWQHHKGHNPHHWEWWIDNVGTRKNTPLKVPYPYVVEMLCDWIGAGKTYNKTKWTQAEPYEYYLKVRGERIIHPRTEKIIIYLLEIIRDQGLKTFCYVCRHPEQSTLLSNYINIED